MSFSIGQTCDGCSACALQCPTAAIFGRFKEMYAVDASLCIDCGVCGDICPREAVFDAQGRLAQRVPRDQRLRPVVAHDLCNGCHLCAAFCPFACLTVNGPRYSGVVYLSAPHACVSCGDCETVCLKGAISMQRLDLRSYCPEVEIQRIGEDLA